MCQLKAPHIPTWLRDPNLTVLPILLGIEKKNADEKRIIEAVYKQIRSINPSWTVYTDGSASAGTANGGTGVVTTIGDPENYTICHTIQ